MPVYEYLCKNCKNKFELLRPFSRSTEGADCPLCHKKAERVLSTCYTRATTDGGIVENIAGSSSCSSCGSSNCSTCGH